MEINLSEDYKKTEIGIIPTEWDVKRLETISEKIMVGIASAATHAYSGKGIILFRNQNIKDGYLDDRDILYIKEEYEELFKNKRLKAGDLIIARTGYPGAACVIPDKYENTQTFTTLITRPKKQSIRSDFLCYFINSDVGHRFFETSQIGGGQKNVNAGSLKFMPIPVPSLPEQKAIAQSLSDVDAQITALEQLITKKRSIKQSTMQQLLTGNKRLPGFSGEWEVKRLGDIVDYIKGFAFKSKDYRSDGVRIIRVSDTTYDSIKEENQIYIENNKINLYTNWQLQENDLVISTVGSKPPMYDSMVGKVVLIKKKYEGCLLNQNAVLIRAKDKNIYKHRLIYYHLKTKIYLRYIELIFRGNANQASITLADLFEFEISLPPSKEEQKAIAQVLSDMDAEIEGLEQKRDKYKSIKQGMMQELLTGKTRLISSS